jgi:Flp pilus assembly protein TadG
MMTEIQTMSLFRTGHRAFAGLRALARDRRGGPVIEFAMAAPALFLFLFGIIELGYAMWIQNSLDFSVATASRCASLNGTACSGQVASYAADQSGADIASSVFTYTCRASDACGAKTATCGCQVKATYSMPLNIPWTDLTVILTSEACYAPPPSKSCAA